MNLGIGSYLPRWHVGNESFQPNNPLDAVGLVKLARKLGVSLVQFADNLPLEGYSEQRLLEVRETAERLGIKLEAGTAGATVEQLRTYLNISKLLGAKLLRLSLHTGSVHPTYEEALSVIRTVLPQYEEAGIAIAIENHFTMSSPQLIALVTEIDSPFVGICVDTANSIRQKEWPEETITLLAPYALSLHLKDYKLETHPDHLGVYITGCALGEGSQDIPFALQAMRDAGREVDVILEQWLPLADSPEETLRLEMEAIQKGVEYARIFLPVKHHEQKQQPSI